MSGLPKLDSDDGLSPTEPMSEAISDPLSEPISEPMSSDELPKDSTRYNRIESASMNDPRHNKGEAGQQRQQIKNNLDTTIHEMNDVTATDITPQSNITPHSNLSAVTDESPQGGNSGNSSRGLPTPVWSPAAVDEKKDFSEESVVNRVSPDECLNMHLKYSALYENCDIVKLPNYVHSIPGGLEGLRLRLVRRGGLDIEGIFRLRGKELKLIEAKEVLANGGTVSDIDLTPIEVAQLIKAWFREVKCDDPGFLSQELLDAHTEDEIVNGFENLSEPRRSVLMWIFDLWIEIEKHKPKNKMTLQSMSIVFSPNLVRASIETNPMIFLQYQKEAQRLLQDASELRQKGRLNPTKQVPDRQLYTKVESNEVEMEVARSSKKSEGGLGSIFKNICVCL